VTALKGFLSLGHAIDLKEWNEKKTRAPPMILIFTR